MIESAVADPATTVHSYNVRICHWINLVACVYLFEDMHQVPGHDARRQAGIASPASCPHDIPALQRLDDPASGVDERLPVGLTDAP